MVYIFLADGFEHTEALAPLDCLRRAGVEVQTVGVTGDIVTSSHGVRVFADTDKAIMSDNVEMIVLPGGGLGTENLRGSQAVKQAITYCVEHDIPVAAICAAPSVPGEMGCLAGHRATCFPEFADYLKGAEYTGEAVTEDGLFITGKSAGHSLTFGLSLVKRLRGEEAAAQVAHALYQNA